MDSPGVILSLLEMGGRLEYACAQFYQQASKLAMHEEARQEFQRLASMELDHGHFFSDLKAKYEKQDVGIFGEHDVASISKYVKAIQDSRVFDFDFILNSAISGHEDVSEIIQLAIGFEKDGIVFYAGLASLVEDGNFNHLLKEIIREEFDHLSQLTRISFL